MAKFLYRDGANYKTIFEADIPSDLLLNIGDETTFEELGINFDDVIPNEYDYEFDHNIVEVTELSFSDLPKNYWEIIVEHLPNYYSRDEVFWSDILSRKINNEDVNEIDVINVLASLNQTDISIASEALDLKLYIEAITEKHTKERWIDNL